VKQPETSDQAEPVAGTVDSLILLERSRHCDWLREDSAHLETLISTMPDSMSCSRLQLSSRLAQHRRELRELMGQLVADFPNTDAYLKETWS
jgi:hypothetical protein